MNRCPISYEPVEDKRYSESGLRLLNKRLTELHDLPFSAEGLRQEAVLRAGRMSIQGMQPKLSAILDTRNARFSIVDSGGLYILKPQTDYPELPQNEDLTMRLAHLAGIETPLHGLVYAQDDSLVYFIKRFDRKNRADKIPLEDFAQLASAKRDTKYNSSMEKIAALVELHCTFPMIEKAKLLTRVLFNFLVGNEDMHLKNFSLITVDDVTKLAPAYDFVNSTIVLRDPVEIALPLNGKQRGLTRRMFSEYYGVERLGLTQKTIDETLTRLATSVETWSKVIEQSFLSPDMRERYSRVLADRRDVLAI